MKGIPSQVAARPMGAVRPLRAEPDVALVVRAQSQADRDAFAELVRRHQGRVRSLLLRLTGGDASLADDLSQDVFLRAFRALPGFARRAEFGTWLYRIAYNVFLNHATRSRRHEPLPPGRETAAGSAASDPPDRNDLRRDIDRAIALLPVPYRAVVVLYYLRDVSYADMAEILGLPMGTVKTHLFRARARLREILLAWDEEDEVHGPPGGRS